MCSEQADRRETLVTLTTHYGNMRFAMFTVFSGLLGALISFPFTDGGRLFFCQYHTLEAPLAFCGMALSLLFTFAELRISYLVTIYQNRLYDSDSSLTPKAHLFWAVLASITMVAPFVISGLFWLAYWLSDMSVPGCTR